MFTKGGAFLIEKWS